MNVHPRDVWVDVTQFGDVVPHRLLAVDGREVDIREAKELYVADRIDVAELEARIAKALALA